MSTTSSTMQAWVYRSKGHPSKVLNLESNYPRPAPSANLVLVKVRAISLNPVGWKTMSVPPLSWMQKTPCVPESDVSGIIVEGDLSGTDLKLGDEVFGIVPAENVMKSGAGTLAEFALVDKSLLRRKPESVSFEQAAAVPLAAHTAFFSLINEGGLKRKGNEGKKVFINGGSGGVGPYAVQIATAYGYQVYTTCSPASRELVQSLSPSVQIFDYTASPLQDQLKRHVEEDKKPFDLIVDTVGVQELYRNSASYLSPKGLYADIAGPHMDGSIKSLLHAAGFLMGAMLRPGWAGGVGRKYKFLWMLTKQENADEMARMLGDGSIKPNLDGVFAFEDAKKAYERSMSGRAKGKVVIRVSE